MTVLYDGACGFCVRAATLLRRWDRTGVLTLLPSQDPTVALRFPTITRAELEGALQVVAADGRRVSGADAIEAIVRALPATRWLRWPFALPFARPAARRLYALVARHRHRLGCGPTCPLPT